MKDERQAIGNDQTVQSSNFSLSPASEDKLKLEL
jgi:hypothetical protein